MVVAYFATQAITNMFPPKILKEHRVTLKMIALGTISSRVRVKVYAQAIVACCGFFLFSQYQTRTNLDNHVEIAIVNSAGSVGCGLLLIVGVWEWIIMYRETIKERRNGKSIAKFKRQSTSLEGIHELHWSFRATSFIVIFLVSVGLPAFRFIWVEKKFTEWQTLCQSASVALFIFSFMSNPREKDRKFIFLLFAAYVSSELIYTSHHIYTGNHKKATSHTTRFFLWSGLFIVGLRFRERVANLSDERLGKFIMESLMKNFLNASLGILFVSFRSLNCVFETGSIEMCENTASCSTAISVYFVINAAKNMVDGAMSARTRRRKAVSWRKMAEFSNLTTHHLFQSLSGGIMILCGMFLFCMMDNADEGETESDRNQEKKFLGKIAILGFICGLTQFALEVRALFNGDRDENVRSREVSIDSEMDDEVDDNYISELNDVWQNFTIVLSTLYSLGWLIPIFNPGLLGSFMTIFFMYTPIAATAILLAIFMKVRSSLCSSPYPPTHVTNSLLLVPSLIIAIEDRRKLREEASLAIYRV